MKKIFGVWGGGEVKPLDGTQRLSLSLKMSDAAWWVWKMSVIQGILSNLQLVACER